ncbi:MAG TPA: glycine betaine ABC transporter substrate-binding protein [Gemmatimonadaceae bacterium]|nr:glycine betaine ABC transporter substrate-binding protein [Gemmatimonadaceae bacterium]
MTNTHRLLAVTGALLAGAAGIGDTQAPAGARTVVVASKPFGESYLLAEMFAQLLEARGVAVERRPGLGATEVAFAALRAGAIDVYPEYTGTGLLVILGASRDTASRDVFGTVQREFMSRFGVRWLPPLGFENTYAIAVRRETAAEHGLRTLSDLARIAPRLAAGLTPDFIGRPDGLPGLAAAYGLRFAEVRPLSQALKYRALASGAVDVVDGYSTDGLIARYDLVVLADDRGFFPPYDAAAMVGAGVQRDNPRAIAALSELSGRLDERLMRELNARVEVSGEPIPQVAASALRDLGLVDRAGEDTTSLGTTGGATSFGEYMWSRRASLLAQALRHLWLVGLALGAAIAVAVPLGLWLEHERRAAEPVIRAIGAVQTIPSIALLAFMVPLLGIGAWPALVALWIYALFPIVRHTYSGVRDADPDAVHAARALGMTPAQVLRHVRTPLAAPGILAGIRTAAVISVGTATLAAFIGAGGLGEPIATGLALADTRLILSGALPAAALALVVDGLLGLVERAVTPAPLRHAAARRADERR